MDTSILEGLGLSKGEIKAYLTLLELGSTKVGQVIDKSGMASSAVHNSLNSLVEKGLVSYIKKGSIKFYQTIPAKQLVDFLEQKKKSLLAILPELEQKQNLAKEKEEAEIFEGTRGMMAMLNLVIDDSKKGDQYLFFALNVRDYNEEIQDFFRKSDAKRKEKGLVIKGLAPKELTYLFRGRKELKVKYPNFPIPSGISICNDKIAFFQWTEKPIGYLIHSKQIADSYREFFNDVWSKLT